MSDHIIDSCSLINLYSGWGRLDELLELDSQWHICDAVANEAEYVREYGPNGDKLLVRLDLQLSIQRGVLTSLSPESEKELEDYVNYATEVDDGEAQALAIAKNRDFILLTDDRRAARLAQRPDINVRTTSTPAVLQSWSRLSIENEHKLTVIIPRIADLARFAPASDSAFFAWWMRYMTG